MKKAISAAIIAFLVLYISASSITVQPLKGATTAAFFSDNFDGNKVDAEKWIVQENTNMSGLPAFGGSVTVADSKIFLTSTADGTSFPSVTSEFNPFPSSGDFAIEFDMAYSCISDWGSGLWLSNGPFIVYNSERANIFQIWAGGGYEQTSVRAFLLEKQIYEDFYGWEEGSKNHLFRIECIKGVYTVFVDSVEVANASSQLRPDTIGFGHPPASYVPFTHERAMGNAGRWCSFKIGFISMRAVHPAVISLSTSASTTQLGFEVDISGALCTPEGSPLFGETVVLSYLIPGVEKWNPFASTTTDLDGAYSVAWLPSATGNFALKAEWAGNEAFAGTYDAKNISVTHSNKTNFFFAESNSTLSALAFNSTSAEISFTVSGSSETRGYVRFLISKALMASDTDLKVHMDGQEVEYVTSSVGDLLSIHVEYAHSSHKVIIKLPLSTTLEASNPLPSQQPAGVSEPQPSEPASTLWCILATVLAAISLSLLIYLKKRK